jgi:predicted RNA-binding protein
MRSNKTLEIIPENQRSKLPLVGEIVLEHPDLKKANDWILRNYEPPKRELCIFVPCSKRKPYHTSPSHRAYDQVIFSLVPHDKVHIVTFGTCGIVPRELDEVYPFAHYDFVLGKCNVIKIKEKFVKEESKRLGEYLIKTEKFYRKRIAYCIGDFRRAMEKAVEMSGVKVTIVPRKETIQKNLQPGKRFIYGSLRMRDYLQDFCDAICSAFNLPKKTVVSSHTSFDNDVEWYVL